MTSSRPVEYCRDRTYPTKHVPTPLRYRLTDTLHCSLDYARTDQLDQLYKLIEGAEERGDNVGRGEFSEEFRNYFTRASELFAVTLLLNTSSGGSSQEEEAAAVDAFVAVHPCQYAMGYDTPLASLRVIRSAALAADDAAWRGLVRLGVQLVRQLDMGYTQVMMDVAFCHTGLLRLLKAEGFTVSVIMQDCVHIKGAGLTANVILCKQLGLPDRPVRDAAAVLKMLRHFDPVDKFSAAYPTMALPQVPFLPQTYTYRCGLRAIIRNMRKDEDERLRSLLDENSLSGETFGLNRYHCIDYFRKDTISKSFCIVHEEATTGKLIGFAILQRSAFTRDDSFQMLNTIFNCMEFREKKIGSERALLEVGITAELGYEKMINRTFTFNVKSVAIANQHLNMPIIGVLPNASYVQGVGWEDIVLMTGSAAKARLFTDLIRENAEKKQHSVSQL